MDRPGVQSRTMNSTDPLLIVAHTPSPNLQAMASALHQGAVAAADALPCKVIAPLQAQADDLLPAGGVVLLTPENLGYMSGAMKDFFDRSYYSLLDHTDALPYALVIRAGTDGTGTRRALESICGGLKWKPVQAPLVCRGEWQEEFLDQCRELGETLVAGLEAGMF